MPRGADDQGPTLWAERPVEPDVAADADWHDLDRDVRGRLRTLSKDSAERVGRHLVMVARLIDDDPELAYRHAQAAVRRGGRVDVVREAAGLAAYRSGRYAEALRELRTVRRLNGSPEHLPVMADAERGLGRPERALAVAADPDVERLDPEARVELAMVVSGARLDLGEPDAAVAVLDTAIVRAATGMLAARVAQARSTALAAAGRAKDAQRELAAFSTAELDEAAGGSDDEDDVAVYDLLEESDEDSGWDDEDDSDDETSDDETSDDEDDSDDETPGDEISDDDSDDEISDGGGADESGAVAVSAVVADDDGADDDPAREDGVGAEHP